MATWALLGSLGTGRSVVSVQSLSDAAPSLSTDGMSLKSVAGFSVTLQADAGQTLSGGGTLTCWTYHQSIAVWSRYPDGDIAIPASVAGNRQYGGVSFQVQSPRGSIAFITNGITVSAGGATLYLIANDLYGSDV